MMSEVIMIGYYKDNFLLTYYAIDVLEKTITCKTQSFYKHVWGKGTLAGMLEPVSDVLFKKCHFGP